MLEIVIMFYVMLIFPQLACHAWCDVNREGRHVIDTPNLVMW